MDFLLLDRGFTIPGGSKVSRTIQASIVILIIDDSRLQTKKSQLQSNIQQSRLQFVQINAQIDALNSQIKAETDRINRIVAGVEAELSGRSQSGYSFA